MDIFQIVFSFFLGILSFVTPCVLPIVPGYLAFLFGSSKPNLLKGAICIYLGISMGGFLIGTVLAALGEIGSSKWFYLVSAILLSMLIVDFLFMHRIRPITFGGILNQKRGYLTGFIFGLLIIFIASPCILPLLATASILVLSVEASSRFVLLLVYSAGLGLPFIIIGAFSGISEKINKAAKTKAAAVLQLSVLLATLVWIVWMIFTI